MIQPLLDAAGRRRSSATMPGFHAGRPPRNKGRRYPADPPTIEEIVAVMRHAGDGRHGRRLRALICAVASGAAHPRGALAQRARSRPPSRLAVGPPRQGRAAPRGEYGRVGLGAVAAVAGPEAEAAHRSAALRHQRPDAGAPVVGRGGACRPETNGRRRGSAATFRTASAAPRTRSRDGSRRGTADRHPAPTRAQQSRHHLDLPPRHRQRRDHRHRPRPRRADDPGQRITPTLKPIAGRRSSR
jgi:hypothetical protein